MHGRVALITGGASGIGRALGEEMARRGAVVVLADRQEALAREVAGGIAAAGGVAEGVGLDVRDAEAFSAVAEAVRVRHGRIDYFFNNAGIAIGGEISHYTRSTWDDVFDVNLRGVAYGIDAVYPIMRAQGKGHIVNTASMAGLLSLAGGGSYTATKHAVVGLSKVLRVEARRHGVRVSVLCPGAIKTPILTGGVFGGVVGVQITDEDTERFWQRMRPMDPGAFAVEVLRDVERNEPYIIVPRIWKLAWLLERIAPRTSQRIAAAFHAFTLRELDTRHGDAVSARSRGRAATSVTPTRASTARTSRD
jgi:NAD(P)-dependent dehydrogenase (short-subunit alcohol dehydrogenase family)